MSKQELRRRDALDTFDFLVRWHGWTTEDFRALVHPHVAPLVTKLLRGKGDARICYERFDNEIVLPKIGVTISYRPDIRSMPLLHRMGTYSFFVHEEQKKEGGMEGHQLLLRLGAMTTVDSSVLDHFVEHPDSVPATFLQFRRIFFWGTRFQNANGSICVRCLERRGYSQGDYWAPAYEWLGFPFRADDAALIFNPLD